VDGCVDGTQEDAGRTEARTKRESNKNSKTQPLGQMRPTGRLSDVIPIGGLPLVFLTPIEFIRHHGNSSGVMSWVGKVSIESDIDSIAERVGEGYGRKFGI
jgi:hypothetical protein